MPRPPARPRPADLEARLAQLRVLADGPDTPALRAALQEALRRGSSVLAARAAEIVGQRRLVDLLPELEALWRRVSQDGLRQDPSCLARRAALEALDRLDAEVPDLVAEAARLVQKEPAWGPPVDTAPPVRARAALALGRLWIPSAPLLLAELLADPAAVVRRAAVEAILHRDDPALAALLVLRYRIRDEDPVLRAECLTALLRMAPDTGLTLATPLLFSADPDDAPEQQMVALALAESRLPQALQTLIDWLGRTVRSERREPILLAIAAHRSTAARAFLLDLIAEEGSLFDARQAIVALAPQLFSTEEHDQLLQAAARRGPPLLAFAQDALATVGIEGDGGVLPRGAQGPRGSRTS